MAGMRFEVRVGAVFLCLSLSRAAEQVCHNTPGWTNGYSACNNYVPVDPDCHEQGVVCHFYEAHPAFCAKGQNDPWMNCCTCGGGSTFDGKRPTTSPPPTVDIPVFNWLPGVKTMEHELGKLKQQMKPLEQGMHEVYAGLREPDFNAPPELEGHTEGEVNVVVLGLIFLVVIATSLGYLLDAQWAASGAAPGPAGRSPAWATAMMATSYVLLLPGLTQVLFSFNIVVNVLGHRINVQPEKDEKACTETVTGLVQLLERTGSRTGAVLIILYAVVVPIVKLLLLALGELFRHSRARFLVALSRICIILVQSISKWACPDMFAYILLVHLVRLLHHDPIILTAAQLDVGFSCFSVFCVCSTVSSLGITLPELPGLKPRSFWLSRPVSFWLAAVLAVLFVLLFFAGLYMPCMALRIDERQLYPPNGSVPYSAKPIVESLAIPDLLKTDISILSCTVWLIQEIGSGEANSLFALVMFGFCVMVLTLADVLLLLAALRLAKDDTSASTCSFYRWAKICRKLAMLDVSIMGVYVITFCMGIYKKQGIVVSTRPGLIVLILAEVAHTLIYWLVSGAMEAQVAQEEQTYEYKMAMAEEGEEVAAAEAPQKLELSCGGLKRFFTCSRLGSSCAEKPGLPVT
mmetsp:Transcript_50070/g.119646  ORF Transcript_50070/g.119646 Transcript_50070/m.119646 type:complete len:632 (-) Transcript_50070:63-1958(-)